MKVTIIKRMRYSYMTLVNINFSKLIIRNKDHPSKLELNCERVVEYLKCLYILDT